MAVTYKQPNFVLCSFIWNLYMQKDKNLFVPVFLALTYHSFIIIPFYSSIIYHLKLNFFYNLLCYFPTKLRLVVQAFVMSVLWLSPSNDSFQLGGLYIWGPIPQNLTFTSKFSYKFSYYSQNKSPDRFLSISFFSLLDNNLLNEKQLMLFSLTLVIDIFNIVIITFLYFYPNVTLFFIEILFIEHRR